MNPDPLEKFILSHREGFDDLEPDSAVWEKIRKRKAPVIRINWKDVAWKAAAVAIIFTASYYFHDYMSSRKAESRQAAVMDTEDPMVKELIDAEVYYTSQINTKKDELYRLASDQPLIHKEVEEDFKELDRIYAELRRDLKDNADNQEVIEAMIQNYRIKLEILEELLYQIQQAKGMKNKKQDEENVHI